MAKYIQSPLNYTGSKYKLLSQILPLFPSNINNFVDLFCGGCNVGINAKAKQTIYVDSCKPLIGLYKTFQNNNIKNIIKDIYKVIERYSLHLSTKNTYCKESYIELRNDFNKRIKAAKFDYQYYIMLYVLIVCAFNNQIRFNSNGEFNVPYGKRSFNKNIESKLISFVNRIQVQNCLFIAKDFRSLPVQKLNNNDFVYADPPYLITKAMYNSGWDETCEKHLLLMLDDVHLVGSKFALSNVLSAKGNENYILKDWIKKNKDKYFVYHLNSDYSNCNYQRKNKESKSDEVLITNYK